MMITSDLDGTLLGTESKLTERTIAAIEAAHAAGIEVVAATGRSWRSALEKVEPTPIRYVICSNGGLIWDRSTNGVLLHRPFVGHDALAVIDSVRAAHAQAGFGWETSTGFDFDEQFLATCPTVDEVGMGDPVGPIEVHHEITKLFMCVPGLRSADLQAAVRAALPPIAQTSSSADGFVETTAAGVDKGSTASWLAAHLGVDVREVTAFGDQLNDVSMLEWAGRAVAMGNAQPQTKGVADHVTASNADDGVAVVIEQMVEERSGGSPSEAGE